ncbi:NADPH-dependent 7-cyano-7-deazaguanine reductase QueF, partial [Myxococcota bacterium]|nr:NADPH-dependent 7-cyano-7-deazaguanine reductase QueF [Myxococcota bacterium]
FRQEGAFHEELTNRIHDDLVSVLSPLSVTVRGDFNIRGGLHTQVTVSSEKPR